MFQTCHNIVNMLISHMVLVMCAMAPSPHQVADWWVNQMISMAVKDCTRSGVYSQVLPCVHLSVCIMWRGKLAYGILCDVVCTYAHSTVVYLLLLVLFW